MSGIEMKNGCIFWLWQSAGFINKMKNMDTMFQSKGIEEWLVLAKSLPWIWSDGVFNRLSKGEKAGDTIHVK